jgi:CRISPR/Cas system-associated exonuclease Cas4 (RecB family)
MFHCIEEKLSENRTKTFLRLDEIENNEAILNRILEMFPDDGSLITHHSIKQHLQTIHNNTIGTFLTFENVGDFAQKCMNILKYIYTSSTARLHPFFFPFSESFVRALDTLSESMMKDVVFADRSSYFLFFRKYITTFHLPFEGTPVSGLQILGFLETRNLTFDTVFLLDVNEETLPDTQKEDSLLPHRARVSLGLPTYLDRDELAAYYFDTLTKGAKEVHLFYCENETKERSRFIEKLLWENQKKSGTQHVNQNPNLIQYAINLENTQPCDIPKSPLMVKFLQDFFFSATSLDTYLTCPIQFFYTYVLKIRRKESLSGEVEKADIGRFVHQVLADYFSKKKGYTLKQNDLDIHSLEQHLNRLFEDTYGKNIMGSAYLLRRQIQRHLNKLFTTYYLPLIRRESVVITNSEYRIRSKFGSFFIKGTIDSIERRNERIFIVDYKTGANPHILRINFKKLDYSKRETWNDSIGSIQLPFYLMLYSEKTGIPMQEMSGIYLLLGKTIPDEHIELHLFQSPEEATAYSDILRAVVYSILNEITDLSVPFTPTANPKQYCPACNYHYLCGTQWYVK